MKRWILIGVLGTTVSAGALVAAETAPAKTAAKAQDAKKSDGMNHDGASGMGKGNMGHGMGGGMMDGGGMMSMCPGMLGDAAKVEVTKLAKGVTISITSDDAKVVARVQKMAEAMRLMHEAHAQ
jgi:hypothetical protein